MDQALRKSAEDLQKSLSDLVGYTNQFNKVKTFMQKRHVNVKSPQEAYRILDQVLNSMLSGKIREVAADSSSRIFVDELLSCKISAPRFGWGTDPRGEVLPLSLAYAATFEGGNEYFDDLQEVDRVLMENAVDFLRAIQTFAPQNKDLQSVSDICSKEGMQSVTCRKAIREVCKTIDVNKLKTEDGTHVQAMLLLKSLCHNLKRFEG